MAKPTVLADASSLIGLGAIGELSLLRELYSATTITHAVSREVLAKDDLPGARELAQAIRAGWVTTIHAPSGQAEFPTLGEGEASTLSLAISNSAPCLVIMDDLSGRAHAKAKDLAFTGVAGVLVLAKRQAIRAEIRPILEELEANGFRLSRQVIEAVLKEAGEA